jgi:hypothetical protein
MNKFLSLFSFLLTTSLAFGQAKGLYLENKQNHRTTFIPEYSRLKIKLHDGTIVRGKFEVLDATTLKIDDVLVPLSSIMTVKNRTMLASIFRPFFIGTGATFIVISVAGLYAGGYAVFLAVVGLPPGLPMFIAPLTSNDHYMEKWSYTTEMPLNFK